MRRGALPRLGIPAIVLLVAADVLLVSMAFDHVSPGEADDRAPAAPDARPAAPEPSADPTVSVTPDEEALLPSGPVHLALAADGAVVLGSSGGCAESGGAADPTPAVLVAPGPQRALRQVPVAEDLTAVLAVDAEDRDDLRVVGAGDDCAVRAFDGTARTDVWSPGPAADLWYLESSGDVHAPGGVVEAPCTPAGLSTAGSVRLLCDDGALLGTPDAGESWVALGRVDGASAFAFDSPSDGVALVKTDSCAVALATTANGGAGWKTSGCLEGSPGRAVAKRGDEVAAVVGETLWRSEDGGETWVRQGG